MTSSPDNSIGRRDFIGAGIAGAAIAAATTAEGQGAATGAPLEVIDFHNHYIGPSFADRMNASTPAQQAVNANLASPNALIDSIAVAGVASRVINTPTAFLEDADGNVPAGLVPRINDAIADFVGKNPGKLHGLATIDAFSGEAGAREVLRAIRELKLRGIFIESAKKDMLLDAPQVRPTLKAAALLGVPVFVHPLTDPQLHTRFSKTGPIGQRLARATINSAALISLIEGGVFEDAPGLKIVVTTLALGGVLLAGGFGDGQRIRKDAALTARRHVYVDTMGIHPASVTAAVELLGADHVLAGTDWPIVVERDVPARLQSALTVAGVSAADQRMVAGGNALKLLGVG